jgi:hypothetical protein
MFRIDCGPEFGELQFNTKPNKTSNIFVVNGKRINDIAYVMSRL